MSEHNQPAEQQHSDDTPPASDASGDSAPTTEDELNERTDAESRAEGGQKPPQHHDYADDEDVLGVEETTVRRDAETGEVLPEKRYVDELDGAVVAKRWPDEERGRWVESVFTEADDEEEVMLSNDDLAELFTRFLEAPNFSRDHPLCPDDRVTPEFVKDNVSTYKQKWIYAGMLLINEEYDAVRMMRGEFSETEKELALKAMENGNFDPQGNRSQNETRRQRRDP